jgi:hypothetical protein
MTFLIMILALSGVGIGGTAVVFRHRRKMREMELRHQRAITESADRTLQG